MLTSMIRNNAFNARLRLLSSISLKRYDPRSKVYNILITRASAQVSFCSNVDQRRWCSNASPEEVPIPPLMGRSLEIFPITKLLTSLYAVGFTIPQIDSNFDAQSFQETAIECATFVSKGLAYEQFDFLAGMIEESCLNELKERIAKLPTTEKRKLEIDLANRKFTQVICVTPDRISSAELKIYILMLFITQADDSSVAHRHNYEFCCSYKNKIPSPWIITHINHDGILSRSPF